MERKYIPIELLLLSDGNPRLEPSMGEDEAIRNMVDNQNNKLFVLASDIVEYGLNPLEIIAVYPSETYSGYYEVGEGNRRVCALKLLISPGRIREVNERLYKKFASLSEKYSAPNSIEVGVFDNESSLQHWMEIRHMGEQNGKGLAKWDAVQKARYNRRQTGADALLDFWDWMILNNILSKKEIKSITKTNWHRIFREKYFPFLKLHYNGRYYVLPKDIELFTERIKIVQKKLSGQTVAIVYDQARLDDFFDSVSESLYGKPYQEVIDEEAGEIEEEKGVTLFSAEEVSIKSADDKSNSREIASPQNTNPDIDSDSDETSGETPSKINNRHNTGGGIFYGCETIIPYEFPIRSQNIRLNNIIMELKRLNVDKFPNACGTLLRVLFELSSKVFLEKEAGNDCSTMQFEQAMRSAANKLQQQGRIDKSQKSAICKDIDDLQNLFNGYRHNTEAYPSSEILKILFKTHSAFIQACLR